LFNRQPMKITLSTADVVTRSESSDETNSCIHDMTKWR